MFYPKLPVVQRLPKRIEEAHIIVAHSHLIFMIENVVVDPLLASTRLVECVVAMYNSWWCLL